MIKLKKYDELENDFLKSVEKYHYIPEAVINRKLEDNDLKKIFNDKVIKIEKILNKFILKIEDLSLEYIGLPRHSYITKPLFVFKIDNNFSLSLSNKSIIENFTFNFLSEKKEKTTPYIIYNVYKKSFNNNYLTKNIFRVLKMNFKDDFYNLDNLLNLIEIDINEKLKDKIGSKMDLYSYNLLYLGKFMHQNVKQKNKQVLNYPFKLKDIEEHVEIEIIKSDSNKPKLTKKIKALKI